MQFVQSVPVAEVLATEGNIQVNEAVNTKGHFLNVADKQPTDCVLTELLQEACSERKRTLWDQLRGDGHLRQELW